jgi:hypothetical protein
MEGRWRCADLISAAFRTVGFFPKINKNNAYRRTYFLARKRGYSFHASRYSDD